MAFDADNLHLQGVAPGDITYTYDAGSDSLLTVITAGYFNNTDDSLNLAVDDLIFVQATDGNMWLRVASISSGSVTTQFAGGDLPVNASTTAAVLVGHTEISGTATAYTLPTPYPGAHVIVLKTATATGGQSFTTDATSVTINPQGDRTITLEKENEGFHLVGSSTTRWRIYSLVQASNGLA